MRIDFGRTADAALICCLMVPSILLAEEAATDRPVLDPATLVKTALVSEVNGEPAERSALLQKALDRDPDFAPARWQSGFVHWDGQWLRPSEVPARVRGNDQLAAYRKLRDAMVDTADNQRELARWCRKNKLPDEERIHWA
ncbi:MAG TPA: hypothetical protein VHV08_14165, partial [Pirellulales bacterium]|nr:hypothetical protein [Pirellulales bacterium]